MSDPAIYCIDVGSTQTGAFGWARLVRETPEQFQALTGTEIDGLIEKLTLNFEADRPVTLGLECPLYLPVPDDAVMLSKGRDGEGSRSCFAPAGGYVGFLGLHQLAYLLQELKDRTTELNLSMDWGKWDSDPDSLLLWEAFVSQEAHTEEDDHTDDALTGAAEFMHRWDEDSKDIDSDLDQRDKERNLSLAGAAIMWTGITEDPAILEQEVLVMRPEESWAEINPNIEINDG